jgi:hypothetical protein
MSQGSATTTAATHTSSGVTVTAVVESPLAIFSDRRSQRDTRRALREVVAGGPDRRLGKTDRRRSELHAGNNWWLKVNYVAIHHFRG